MLCRYFAKRQGFLTCLTKPVKIGGEMSDIVQHGIYMEDLHKR